METQDPKDLKENDLAEFFENFGEWWQRWGNTVLIIFVLLAGGFAAYRFMDYRAVTAHESAWGDLAAADSPEAYVRVASDHAGSPVEVLAYLRGADLYLAEAMPGGAPDPVEDIMEQQGLDPEAGQEQVDPEEEETAEPDRDPVEALARARQAYQRVLELTPQRVYRVNALMGLAAVAEWEQEWDQAVDYYDQAEELAGEYLPGLARKAAQRRGLLGEIRDPVAFAPEDLFPAEMFQQPGMMPGMDGMGPPPAQQPGPQMEGELPEDAFQLDLDPGGDLIEIPEEQEQEEGQFDLDLPEMPEGDDGND